MYSVFSKCNNWASQQNRSSIKGGVVSVFKLNIAFVLIIALALAGCGSDSGSVQGSGDNTRNESTNGSQDQNTSKPNVEYLRDDSPHLQYQRVDIKTRGTTSLSMSGTTQSNPLDIQPGNENGFEFSWSIGSPFAVFASRMLILRDDKQEIIPIFDIAAFNGQSTLNATAVCDYGNDNVIDCKLPATSSSYAFSSSTDLSESFDALPKTFEVLSEACNLLHGCDVVRIGYIRFN